MTDAKLRIILSAQDEATSDINKVSSALDKVGASARSSGLKWTELNSVIAIGRQVLDIAKQGYDAIITPTIEYAAQVRNLSRISGESAESTSRLIQVSDDMTISYETLGQAAKIAAKQDISMSIDSMARLSDEYLRLAPGTERATYLLKTFGKSGLEMGKLLDQGSDSILKMSDGISDNLIMTRQATYEARQYEIATDEFVDSIKGLGYAAGKVAVPALTKMTNSLTLTFDAISLSGDALKRAQERIVLLGGGIKGTTAATGAASTAYDGWTSAIDRMADSAENADIAMADIAKATSDRNGLCHR